jgi:hypothetical protein
LECRPASLALAGAIAAIAFACGGRIASGPPGTLDDAGVFRSPDGQVLFAPGSACITYDAAHYIEVSSAAPTCEEATGTESPSCEAWAGDAGLSFGYLPYAECRFGRCSLAESALAIHPNEPAVACVWGPDGNAYCQAFYRQFALHGVVGGACNKILSSNDRGQNGVCTPDGCGMVDHVASVADDGGITFEAEGGGALAGIPIEQGGGYAICENICEP